MSALGVLCVSVAGSFRKASAHVASAVTWITAGHGRVVQMC